MWYEQFWKAEVFPVFIDEIRVLFTDQYIDRQADNGRTVENNTFLNVHVLKVVLYRKLLSHKSMIF